VTNLWRSVFADVAASQTSLDGERVFIDDAGTVFELGIPLEVTMRPIDVAAGWRFGFGRVSPYVGAGVTFLTYGETSDLSEGGEDVDESGTGALVLGGVDVQVWRWVFAGGEVRYRRVSGILGEGGVSAHFGEDNAGGVSAAVRISIGR
jgi:opacity protein-like surface antigen